MDDFYAKIAKAAGVSAAAAEAVSAAEESLRAVFARIERIEEICAARVLRAFTDEGIAARHFAPSTGYGYDDVGRDALDRVLPAHSKLRMRLCGPSSPRAPMLFIWRLQG